jgi:hypothetical protein
MFPVYIFMTLANKWIVPPPCADIREKISDHDLRKKKRGIAAAIPLNIYIRLSSHSL